MIKCLFEEQANCFLAQNLVLLGGKKLAGTKHLREIL